MSIKMEHMKNTMVILAVVLIINITALLYYFSLNSNFISSPYQMNSMINLTTCSINSAMIGQFHRKVISFSYYETNVFDKIHRNYFNGIEKNLQSIKYHYGLGWSMRLYVQLSKISSFKLKKLYQLTCMYPEQFDICDVESIPRFGNLSNIFPMNWRILTMLDPQVDVAFSRDLDSIVIQREMDAINEFLNSSKLVHVMRDNPVHNMPIMGGMWGIKLTPDIRSKLEHSFMDMFRSPIFYKSHKLKGPDQDIIRKFIWPWAKIFTMGHDSYSCKRWANSRPFPTQRKNENCNFIGCIFEAPLEGKIWVKSV